VDGEGPFLWLTESGPRAGFRQLPKGGMCLSVFLFVHRGAELLLGKYADDPRWETLAGLDTGRWRKHGQGWTLPASHLKYGEHPRDAARRVAEDVLQLPGLALSEPRVETEFAVWTRPSGTGEHYDVWFFVDAELPARTRIQRPPWYSALEFHDPRRVPASAYGRAHEDVVARWLGQ
jgi:ADP-ribose pyrophosphatase YjhB (NUDIX family)